MKPFRSSTRRSQILIGDRPTTFFQRASARAIDLLVGTSIYFIGNAIVPPVGLIAALLYTAFQDGIGEGQSVGKKIMGMRVFEDALGGPCTFQASLVRNVPFLLAFLLGGKPMLWLFFVLLVIPVLALEAYLLMTLDSGVRLGDVMANTWVSEHVEETIEPMPQ